MRAGLLRKKLVFLRAGDGVDVNGQPLETPWTVYYTTWGEVTPSPAGESVANNQRVATRNYEISIRHRPGIQVTDRVIHEGSTLEITGVTSVDRQRELKITATEVYL